jgi:hypothetical protein
MQKPKFIYPLLFLFISIFTVLESKAQFLKKNLSLFAGLIESKQNINTGNFSSKFNYRLSDYQNNVYKPGYFFGFRIEENSSNKHKINFSLSYHQMATGTNYNDAKYLSPFTQAISNYKADDHFSMLAMNVHYKREVFTDHNEKRKYFLIAGPSVSIRLSNQTEDNQAYNNYTLASLNGDVGAEIENKSSYTLFVHYKQPLTSFTKNEINTRLSSLSIGILFKASELF